MRKFEGHAAKVSAVTFSPDGKKVLTGDIGFKDSKTNDITPGVAILWEVDSGKRLWSFKGNNNGIELAAFSPDGKTVLTVESLDNTSILRDVTTGEELKRFNTPLTRIY